MSGTGLKGRPIGGLGRNVRIPRHHGFTLIELLVTLTLLAFILGGVYGVFRAAHESIARVDQRTALTQIGRVLLSDLSRELASIYPLEIDLGYPEYGLPEAELAPSEGNPVTFWGEDQVAPDGRDVDTLRFTTATNDPRRRIQEEEASPGYDLAEVLYYIDDDDSTPERGLTRQSNNLPGLATEEVTPEMTEISANVIGMNIRYLDDSGEEPEWLDRWEDTQSLPAALELTLLLTPDPEIRDLDTARERGRVISTLVSLPIRTPVVPVGAAPENAVPEPAGAGGAGEEGPPGEGGGGGRR